MRNKSNKGNVSLHGRVCKISLQASVPSCIFYFPLEILLFQKELKKIFLQVWPPFQVPDSHTLQRNSACFSVLFSVLCNNTSNTFYGSVILRSSARKFKKGMDVSEKVVQIKNSFLLRKFSRIFTV